MRGENRSHSANAPSVSFSTTIAAFLPAACCGNCNATVARANAGCGIGCDTGPSPMRTRTCGTAASAFALAVAVDVDCVAVARPELPAHAPKASATMTSKLVGRTVRGCMGTSIGMGGSAT